MTLYIRDGLGYQVWIIVKRTKSCIAIETEDPPDPTGFMIVIHLDCRALKTDGTDAALRVYEGLDISCSDAVAALQMVVAFSSVKPLLAFPNLHVVTDLAVQVVPVGAVAVTREISSGFNLAALRTPFLS